MLENTQVKALDSFRLCGDLERWTPLFLTRFYFSLSQQDCEWEWAKLPLEEAPWDMARPIFPENLVEAESIP